MAPRSVSSDREAFVGAAAFGVVVEGEQEALAGGGEPVGDGGGDGAGAEDGGGLVAGGEGGERVERAFGDDDAAGGAPGGS